MSLWWKINKVMTLEEKTLLKKMLNKCLGIRSLWCKAMTDTTKTDHQCDFAYSKLEIAKNEMYVRFPELSHFKLDEIKMCIE